MPKEGPPQLSPEASIRMEGIFFRDLNVCLIISVAFSVTSNIVSSIKSDIHVQILTGVP